LLQKASKGEHGDFDCQDDNLFQLKGLPDELGFTSIRRIVLGLSKLDLQTEVEEQPELINLTDTLGRTALWWSSRRDQTESSAILLDWGADPNIVHHAGHSSLHNAVTRGG